MMATNLWMWWVGCWMLGFAIWLRHENGGKQKYLSCTLSNHPLIKRRPDVFHRCNVCPLAPLNPKSVPPSRARQPLYSKNRKDHFKFEVVQSFAVKYRGQFNDRDPSDTSPSNRHNLLAYAFYCIGDPKHDMKHGARRCIGIDHGIMAWPSIDL